MSLLPAPKSPSALRHNGFSVLVVLFLLDTLFSIVPLLYPLLYPLKTIDITRFFKYWIQRKQRNRVIFYKKINTGKRIGKYCIHCIRFGLWRFITHKLTVGAQQIAGLRIEKFPDTILFPLYPVSLYPSRGVLFLFQKFLGVFMLRNYVGD